MQFLPSFVQSACASLLRFRQYTPVIGLDSLIHSVVGRINPSSRLVTFIQFHSCVRTVSNESSFRSSRHVGPSSSFVSIFHSIGSLLRAIVTSRYLLLSFQIFHLVRTDLSSFGHRFVQSLVRSVQYLFMQSACSSFDRIFDRHSIGFSLARRLVLPVW